MARSSLRDRLEAICSEVLTLEIPCTPSDLDATWLTQALRGANILNSGVVGEFEVLPLEGEQGFYGQIVRVSLSYDPPDAEGPATLIAKFSSPDPKMRGRPNTRASYQRELQFYRTVAPEQTLSVPACYYGDVDSASGWHVLLLQDLAPAQSGSRINGCSGSQARAAVRSIARFQADWWEDPRLQRMDRLASSPASSDDARTAELYQDWWRVFLERAQGEVPADMIQLGESLGRQRGRIARHLFGAQPQTLVHSDYKLDNMLFGGPEPGFYVVDWQFVRRGRGIWDVAYFLAENLQPYHRREIEDDALKDYVEILREHGVAGYSLQDVLADYRISLLHRFGLLVSTIAAIPLPEREMRAHVEVLLPRTITAIQDHNAGSVLDGNVLIP
jgi:hypothetical protein